MFHGLGAHLRHNVVGYLALFVALGGTGAYAANEWTGANVVDESLTGRDVKDGSLYSHDVANGTLRGSDVLDEALGGSDVGDGSLTGLDLRNGSVYGHDVATDSLTGYDVAESTLGTVPNSDTLDGVDSSAFARKGSEPWIDAQFDGADFDGLNHAPWGNALAGWSTAAYFRDAAGVVHLKGLVKAHSAAVFSPETSDDLIFKLPEGYRPTESSIFAILSNDRPARLTITGAHEGWVRVEPGFPTEADAKQWVSLDGVSFRCDTAPSFGCP